MVLVGNNSLVHRLQILTPVTVTIISIPQHPCSLTVVNERSQYFKNIDNLLLRSVSEESSDSGKTKQDLVKQEAI